MQYSAEFIILAPPFDSNFQITWQKMTSWEKWILRIKPCWLPFILDSPTSAPRGQRLLLQPVQKPGNNPRVPVLLILDIRHFSIRVLVRTRVLAFSVNVISGGPSTVPIPSTREREYCRKTRKSSRCVLDEAVLPRMHRRWLVWTWDC